MAARPPLEQNPDEPEETLLRVLPEKHHECFLAEYAVAVDDARQLRRTLRLWRLRAAANADPAYEERRAAARDGLGDWVPIEQAASDWPFK